MPATFQCTVVTPEAPILDEEVRHVAIPAWDGQVGILARRAPLLVKLGSGPLRIDLASGGSRTFFVSGGFAQMKGNALSVLSDEAMPAEAVDREEAEAALRAAQALRGLTPDNAQKKHRDVERARALLAVADTRASASVHAG